MKKKLDHILLGCVADDFTGASDAASFLAKQGIKTPVSYTHLDVYKRQAYRSPPSTKKCWKCAFLHTPTFSMDLTKNHKLLWKAYRDSQY